MWIKVSLAAALGIDTQFIGNWTPMQEQSLLPSSVAYGFREAPSVCTEITNNLHDELLRKVELLIELSSNNLLKEVLHDALGFSTCCAQSQNDVLLYEQFEISPHKGSETRLHCEDSAVGDMSAENSQSDDDCHSKSSQSDDDSSVDCEEPSPEIMRSQVVNLIDESLAEFCRVQGVLPEDLALVGNKFKECIPDEIGKTIFFHNDKDKTQEVKESLGRFCAQFVAEASFKFGKYRGANYATVFKQDRAYCDRIAELAAREPAQCKAEMHHFVEWLQLLN